MKVDSMASLTVQISHGQDKHDVEVTLPPGATELTVLHLAKAVAKVTEVPVNGQKLICKGKSINDQFASLMSVGITNNSKIMLLGKKTNMAADANMAAMAKVEREVIKVEARVCEHSKEFDGIKNGFLSKDLAPEALKKMGLAVGVCSEEFTRGLEKLDSLTLADGAPEVRQRRKTLVQRIQGMLDKCDLLRGEVREEQGRR